MKKLTFDIEKHDVDRLTTTIIENIKKIMAIGF